MDTTQVLLLGASFILGIFSSISASIIWDWMKGNISFRTSDYPDLRETWTISTKLKDGQVLTEQATVKKQLLRSLSGVLTSPNPENPSETVELIFEGYLIDRYTVRYSFKPKSGNFSDFGVGLLKIGHDHRHASGASVSVGIMSGQPTTAIITMAKQS
jgi:hypothetical protein